MSTGAHAGAVGGQRSITILLLTFLESPPSLRRCDRVCGLCPSLFVPLARGVKGQRSSSTFRDTLGRRPGSSVYAATEGNAQRVLETDKCSV